MDGASARMLCLASDTGHEGAVRQEGLLQETGTWQPAEQGSQGAPSMKLFALVLTLAVLAGSQASLLSDEPTPRLEQVREAFWEYMAKAEKIKELIHKSELGREINSRVSHSLLAAYSYGTEVQKQLPAVAQELVAKLSKDTDLLVQKVSGDLRELNQKVQPSIAELQKSVEELQAGLAPYAEGLLEQLHSQLGPYAQDLQGRLGSLWASFLQHFQ
nr:apolipoprotein A-I-like isoform X1 [Chrysemys picta bellii]XP_042696704.1 apolipoprotein A-I-like isoform X1 [Chrysemys picta bellii]